MQVHYSKLPAALNMWVTESLIPRSSLVQQGIITFILIQGKDKIEAMFEPLKLLADDKGQFDVDTLQKNLHSAIEKMGGSYTVPLLNYKFDGQDLDELFAIIKKGAV